MTRFMLLAFTWLVWGAAPALEAKIQVLTTFAPIDSLTRSVAGEAANVQMLLPPGVGPHDFSFTPGDVRKIAAADVIVLNGLGMESWLNKTLDASRKKSAIVIDTSKGVKTLEIGEEHAAEHAEPEEHDHHHHGNEGVNPHIWLDPKRAMQQVENIVQGLGQADPTNIEIYKANAVATLKNLEKLDEDILRQTSGITDRKILTFHDSFPYFADRYKFDIVAVFESFPGREPSPKYLINLKKKIRENQVKVLFSEPQYSPQIMKNIASEAGVRIAVLDPMETGEPSASYYESVMRKNLASLMEALKAEIKP